MGSSKRNRVTGAGAAGVAPALIRTISAIVEEISSARFKASGAKNYPFFQTFLRNFLGSEFFSRKENPKREKEIFLSNYQNLLAGAPNLYARSCVQQLIDADEELTLENTPEAFHVKRTIWAKEMTVGEAINQLKKEKKALSANESAQVDFFKDNYTPSETKARIYQSRCLAIADCMERAWMNLNGLSINPLMPSVEAIGQFAREEGYSLE